jgi:ParB family chromosome partitioning protein
MAASFMGSKKGDLSASCEKLFAGETIVAPEVKEAALAWVPAMRFRVIAASDSRGRAVVRLAQVAGRAAVSFSKGAPA